MKMVTFLKRYQRQLFGLLIIGLFVIYYLRNKSDFEVLSHVSLGHLAVVALGYMAIVMTNGLFIRYVVRPFGVEVGNYESTRISLLSSLGNFFATSGAGLGYRALYLKKHHNLAYRDYMTTLYGNYLIIFIVNSFAGLVALALAHRPMNGMTWGAGALFSVILASSILVTVHQTVVKKRSGLVGKVIQNIRMMSAGWQTVAKDRTLLANLTGLVLLQLAITVLILYFETSALSIQVGFADLLFLSVLSAFSVFINITPANLGIKEGAYILSTTIIGLGYWHVLAIAVIDRVVLFVTLGVLWLVLGRNRKVTVHGR